MLQVQNVTKAFSKGDTQVTAVNDVSFTVEDGKFVSIIGRSGSGKSTLLSLLGALDRPTSGQIAVDGKDITQLGTREQTRYRARDIGFVFQGYNLIPNLTAAENVMLVMEAAGTGTRARRARAADLLDRVGLDRAKQRRKPGRLSGGEQQRVAVARALANNPSLILADEPTGNLDNETATQIFDLLRQLSRSENTTIIVVTHDLDIARKTDAVFKLRDGAIT